jgi:hypothetical protein
LSGACAGFAQTELPVEAHMTWFDVYQTDPDAIGADDSAVHGKRTVSSGITPPTTNSDRIRADLNSRFGFGFTLTGAPDGTLIHLRLVRRFPAPGLFNNKTGGRRIGEDSILAFRVGQKELFYSYKFELPAERVSGVWTLEIWQGERRLLEKSFTIVVDSAL